MRTILLIMILLLSGVLSGREHRSMRILTYNVCEGIKMDTTETKSRFISWMKELGPDIAALQELNGFTQLTLEKLAESYGHPYAVLLKETGYPVALTSRYPIVAERVTENMHHGFLIARTGGYNIVVAHLSPFDKQKRIREVSSIMAWISSTGQKGRWILAGDFNSRSPLDCEGYAPDMKPDFETQQKLLDAGYVDALKELHSEYIHTYPSPAKVVSNTGTFTTYRLDYIYLSKDMKKHILKAEVLNDADAAFLSDHLPLYVEIK